MHILDPPEALVERRELVKMGRKEAETSNAGGDVSDGISGLQTCGSGRPTR